MKGGGFLKQGADSAKNNRALLGKEKHKPFETKEIIRTNLAFKDDQKMSQDLQDDIRLGNEAFNRSEARKRLIMISVACFILVILLWYLLP